MAKPPAISVIIPTYNRAATLAASLDSVLAQRFTDLEVIVADDGSSDGTDRILARYGSAVRVLRQEHLGAAAARNAALAMARGNYIAFHDSDDVALEGRLELQHRYLAARPELGAVMCNGWLGSLSGRPWIRRRLARRLEARGVGLTDVFADSLALMQAMLFRRAAVTASGGFDATLERLSDLEFVLRFALRWRIGFVNTPVFVYQLQSDSLNADRLAVREQSLVIIERLVGRHPEALARLGERTVRRRRAHRYYSLARLREERGELRAAAEAAARAVNLAPLDPRYRLLRWRLGPGG